MRENGNKKSRFRDFFLHCSKSVRRQCVEIERVYNKCFEETEPAFVWMSTVLCSALLGAICMGTGLPSGIDFLLFSGVALLLCTTARLLLQLVLYLFFRKKGTQLISFLMLAGSLFAYLILCLEGEVTMWRLGWVAMAVTCVQWLFSRSSYAVVVKKRRTLMLACIMLVSLFCNVMVVRFSVGTGISDSFVATYLDRIRTMENSSNMKDSRKIANSASIEDAYKEAIQTGTYTVASCTYGFNEDKSLASDTVNLHYFVGGYTGFTQWVRTLYWKFPFDKVPLQGKIWYPEEKSNCPVVFVVHGNHTMITESYLGYEYIGEHLASKGYVVVSVNENVLNYYIDQGLVGENAGRAGLLLSNMEQVERYNHQEDSILYGKMDFEKIALIGHSRGGEAVSLATLYNQLTRNPDNANMVFPYDFNIRSIISVAPTVDQYQPSGKDVQIEDVNYLLIQGANDQDVNSFLGVKQYHNVVYSGKEEYYKVYKYIFGANHGQFNTEWITDYSGIRSLMLNQANLMSGEEQRQVLLAYVTAFLEDTLEGKREFRPLLLEENTGQEVMPRTVYITAWESSEFVPIATYEEDLELERLTMENTTVLVEGMYYWKEIEVPFYQYNGYAKTENHALFLQWKQPLNEPKYAIRLSRGLDMESRDFIFNIADYNVEAVMDKTHQQVSFSIRFTDEMGQTAVLSSTQIVDIVPPIPVRLYKMQWLEEELKYRMNFQTVRISSEQIKQANAKIALHQIASVEFRFDQVESGIILLDDIGTVPPMNE